MKKALWEILQLASPASFFQLTLCLIYQFQDGFRKAFLHWALKNQLECRGIATRKQRGEEKDV